MGIYIYIYQVLRRFYRKIKTKKKNVFVSLGGGKGVSFSFSSI